MSALTIHALAVLRVVAQRAEAPEGFVSYGSESEWSYVLVGWGVVIVGIALYALLVLRKGRQLAKQLPPDERRWTG